MISSPFSFAGYDNIPTLHYVASDRIEETIEKIMTGVIEPRDKQFFKLQTGMNVFVKGTQDTVFEGKIIKSDCGTAYLIELSPNEFVSHRLLNPKAQISSDKPTVYRPDRSNHNVYLSKKQLDLGSIDFIMRHIQSYKIPIWDVIKNLEYNIETYPEEFI